MPNYSQYINESIFTLPYDDFIYRIPKISDKPEIFILRSDVNHNQNLNRPLAKSIEEAKNHTQFLIDGIEEGRWINYVITRSDKDKCIGLIGFYNFEDCQAEIGYELMPQDQGKGVMSIALKRMIQLAKDKLHLKLIIAHVDANNAPSIRLVEKNNFIRDTSFLKREEPSLQRWTLTL